MKSQPKTPVQNKKYENLLFSKAELKVLFKALKYDIEENGNTKLKRILLGELEFYSSPEHNTPKQND